MEREQILADITNFYLMSPAFNGIPLRELLKAGDASVRLVLDEAIRDGEVCAVFGDGHPNPHIRALPEHHKPDEQITMLDGELADGACIYPLPGLLRKHVNKTQYAGKPYALALALGGTQLSHLAFDLSVLEAYRNDPRYSYQCDDIHGTISVHDEHFETGSLKPSDEVLLQYFGFCYDEDGNKYVAVFLWDLFKLSPEHQRIWEAKEVRVETRLHPDFYRSAILGQFPEGVSMYQAFLEEMHIINQMSAAMGRPYFFRHDYHNERPREFASLLRPTVREFNSFVLLLDKMMSDNINKAFFRREVPSEVDHTRPDGKIEVRQIGTIRMLGEWIRTTVRMSDPTPVDEMLASFREVRTLRQKPAHAVDEDRFEQGILGRQREVMKRAYTAVRHLRLLFANHPGAKAVEVPEWLWEGQIWTK